MPTPLRWCPVCNCEYCGGCLRRQEDSAVGRIYGRLFRSGMGKISQAAMQRMSTVHERCQHSRPSNAANSDKYPADQSVPGRNQTNWAFPF